MSTNTTSTSSTTTDTSKTVSTTNTTVPNASMRPKKPRPPPPVIENAEIKSNLQKTFISPCCKAFIAYVDNILICSHCQQTFTLKDDEEITTSIIYNVNETNDSNISSDLLENRKLKSKRCAHDVTLELVDVECPECKTRPCRFARNLNEAKFFICPKCRNVFE